MHNSYTIHAIVGYGYPSYFVNALKSVRLAAPSHPVIVIITGGVAISEISSHFPGDSNIKYIEIEHSNSGQKTGSLYTAYKWLFNYCSRVGFRYVNIIQNDMQLMWWDSDIEDTFVDMLNIFTSSLLIQTGAPRFGSHPLFHSNRLKYLVSNGISYPYDSSNGWSDWGFYSVDRVLPYISFLDHSESALSSKLNSLSIVLPFSILPTTFPIPWPSTFRNGCYVGSRLPVLSDLYLVPRSSSTLAWFKSIPYYNFFEEDLVEPYGWYCLTPYWATTPTKEYIDIRNSLISSVRRPLRWISHGLPTLLVPPASSLFSPKLHHLP